MKLSNAKGFSLTEVIVGMGVEILVLFAAVSVFFVLNREYRRAEFMSFMQQDSGIYSIVKQSTCENIYRKNSNDPVTFIGINVPISVEKIVLVFKNDSTKTSDVMKTSVMVGVNYGSILLTPVRRLPIVLDKDRGALTPYLSEITISATPTFSSFPIVRNYTDVIYVGADNKLTACPTYDPEANALSSLCDGMFGAGSFNGTNCTFGQCPANQYLRGITAAGKDCQPLPEF